MEKTKSKGFLKAIGRNPIKSLIVGMILVYLVISAITYAKARFACHTRWVDSSIESKYTIRGGCLVKHEGSWIPERNFRIN